MVENATKRYGNEKITVMLRQIKFLSFFNKKLPNFLC